MKNYIFDVVVIGGGPAGISAAIAANKKGASVAVIERNPRLGGILLQCIHSGFGLKYFKQELTGPEYAQRLINSLDNTDIKLFLSTMVLQITPEKQIFCMNENGIEVIHAKSVILAMGCRERTRGEIKIPGERCAGVLTAGLAQHYINIDNYCPGHKFVILGSGDIGLIMARRLSLEGMKVQGVYELMPYPNGLTRNIKNCLEDFNIPLHLSTTVTRIIGKNGRVTGVEVTKVDESMKPIKGTCEIIPCDTLLLSVGLIPENELSINAGVKLNSATHGAVVDDSLQTNVPGIFACGNVLHVHDLADNVTVEAEHAGNSAALYAKGFLKTEESDVMQVKYEFPIGYTVPSKIYSHEKASIFFRIRRPYNNASIVVSSNGNKLLQSKPRNLKPNAMEKLTIPDALLKDAVNDITIKIETV